MLGAIMCDRIADPIGLQTSVEWKLHPKYDYKIKGFFSKFNFMARLMMWRLLNKYCSSFGTKHQVNFSSL